MTRSYRPNGIQTDQAVVYWWNLKHCRAFRNTAAKTVRRRSLLVKSTGGIMFTKTFNSTERQAYATILV
jgi:hypothetical protein